MSRSFWPEVREIASRPAAAAARTLTPGPSNTIAGNARQYFGSEFLISVPIVLFGRPDKISFPRHLKSFVIPITWRTHRSYLIICIERAAADRDAPGMSSRPGVIANLQP